MEMNPTLARLSLAEGHYRSAIFGCELGTRQPPLPVLLTHAQIARVWVDALIDDGLETPEKLPGNQRKKQLR